MTFLTDRRSPTITTSSFIMSFIFMIIYVLIMNNAIYLIFMIPLVVFFILSDNKSSIDKSLESVGWSNKELSYVLPMGLLCGLICLIVGSLIIQINLLNACLSPSTQIFLNDTKFFTNATLILILNIIFQFFIVAPSEETAFRGVVPYALESLSNFVPDSVVHYIESPLFTYTLSSMLWALFHYPTYHQNNADPNMYIVVIIWGIIFTIFMYVTDSILTCVIGHATTNISILLINDKIFEPQIVLFTLVGLIIVSFIYHVKKGGKIYSKLNRNVI